MNDSSTLQLAIVAFGGLFALIGVFLFILAMIFRYNPSGVSKVTFLRVGFETPQPSLVIFLVGSGLIVAPLFVGERLTGEPPRASPTPTSAATVPGLHLEDKTPTSQPGDTRTDTGGEVPGDQGTSFLPSPTPTTSPNRDVAGTSTLTMADLVGEFRRFRRQLTTPLPVRSPC